MAITSTKIQIATDTTFNAPIVDYTYSGEKEEFNRDELGGVLPTGVPLHIRAKKVDSEMGDSDWGEHVTVRIQDTLNDHEFARDFIGKYSDDPTQRKYLAVTAIPSVRNVNIPSDKVLLATNDPANDNKLTIYMFHVDKFNGTVSQVGSSGSVIEGINIPAGGQISLTALSPSVALLTVGSTEIVPIEIGTDTVTKGNNHLMLTGGGELGKIGHMTSERIATNVAVISITSGVHVPDALRVFAVKYNTDTKAFTQAPSYLELEGAQGDTIPFGYLSRIDDTRMLIAVDRTGTVSSPATVRVLTVNTAGNLGIAAGDKHTINKAPNDDLLIGSRMLPGGTKFVCFFKIASNSHLGTFIGNVTSSTISPLDEGNITDLYITAHPGDIFAAISPNTVVSCHESNAIYCIKITATNAVSFNKSTNGIGFRIKDSNKWKNPNTIITVRHNRAFCACANRLYRLIG